MTYACFKQSSQLAYMLKTENSAIPSRNTEKEPSWSLMAPFLKFIASANLYDFTTYLNEHILFLYSFIKN